MDRREGLIGESGDRVAIWRGRLHCTVQYCTRTTSACPLVDGGDSSWGSSQCADERRQSARDRLMS